MRLSLRLLPALVGLLAGCSSGPKDTGSGETGAPGVDADGDGVTNETDCNDADAAIFPGADELCDGLDNDCDRSVDEGLDTSPWYTDADGDGYGDPASEVDACVAPAGAVSTGGDCNDADAAWHPGAEESDCTDPNDYNCDGSVGAVDGDADGFAACEECDDGNAAVNPDAPEVCDGVDDNCDGRTDDDTAVDSTWFYPDADGDGYGVEDGAVRACAAPEGYAAAAGDCDDSSVAFHPGAEESDCTDPNDYNCDGTVGAGDGDGDGFAACEDCDDTRASAYPGAPELCNDLDDDCNGAADDAAIDAPAWYPDADGDGYGTEDGRIYACAQPEGYASVGGDCDDTSVAWHPNADESDCSDPNDYNCDGSSGYSDLDGDGVPACEDCNDVSADAYPGATETCDGVDDDCDGVVDEPDAVGAATWYGDADADGYGVSDVTSVACTAPAGMAAEAGDCDDTDPAWHPNADESDCTDPNDYNCDGSTGYVDSDGDGSAACEDCDDHDANAHPGGVEVCDGADNDCNSVVDDPTATDAAVWYDDNDGDGHGDPSAPYRACAAPAGFVATADDCDDADASVHPGALELCDGVDDDCDGSVDLGAADAPTWYADADGDSFGDADVSVTACEAPAGYLDDASDCNDAVAYAHPGSPETCDGIDDDCDGAVDESSAVDASVWYVDGDADGVGGSVSEFACSAPSGEVATTGDCNDANAAIHPGATEVCDGLDNDCDGLTDPSSSSGTSTWHPDADADGYGSSSIATLACTAPSGYVADNTDCNDAAAAVHPGATETCNSIDDNCDGSVDPASSVGAPTWYVDADHDAYGGTTTAVQCTAPSGYVSVGGDCNDAASAVHPGATETCNSIDDNCDGLTDPDGSSGATTYYQDGDSDTYGNVDVSRASCSRPSGYVTNATDCDDTTNRAHPGLAETCGDLLDNDCDGTSNTCATTGAFDNSAADWDVSGTESYQYLGYALGSGSLDSLDDLSDVVAGSPGYDGGGSSSTTTGRVYVWYSPLYGSDTLSGADLKLSGSESDATFGKAVTTTPDLDGDGTGEIVVGAPGQNAGSSGSNQGVVYVYDGGRTGTLAVTDAVATLSGSTASAAFGFAVRSIGDVTGDGVGDLGVSANLLPDGADTEVGGVFVFAGPLSGALSDTAAVATVKGDDRGDQLGTSLAGGQDVDGDGVDDVIMGAPYDDGAATDAGAVYLFLDGPGSVGLYAADADGTLRGGASRDGLGIAAALLPDSDGDGYAEVVVGAAGVDNGHTDVGMVAWLAGGAAGPFAGTVSVSTADAFFYGPSDYDYLGASVASGGDVDADGRTDLLMGSPGYDRGGSHPDAGAIYLQYGPFSGSLTLTSYDVRLRCTDTSDAMGVSVAGLGDIDGDGYDDWAGGAPTDNAGATDGGSFFAMYGVGL